MIGLIFPTIIARESGVYKLCKYLFPTLPRENLNCASKLETNHIHPNAYIETVWTLPH